MASAVNGLLNFTINNSSVSSNTGLAFKFSGKGATDAYSSANDYDKNGIGFQLWSNTSNSRELAIVDTANINNNNFSALRIQLTSNSTLIRSITSNGAIRPLIINNNLTITSNMIGLGTTNPTATFDVRGNMSLTGKLIINNAEISTLGASSSPTTTVTKNLITGTTNYYYLFTSATSSITFDSAMTGNIIIVGAGGNGGTGSSSGGGGAGEVIYYPNYLFSAGTYNLTVGQSSSVAANRISKITLGSTDVIKANGGGDGGFFQLFTANGSITLASSSSVSYNYGSFNSIASGTYNITFATGAITVGSLAADKSYPILKNASSATINPYIWYKFDNSAANLITDEMGINNLTNSGVTFDTTNFIKGNGSAGFASSTGGYFTFNNTIPFHTMQSETGLSISFWQRGLSTSAGYAPLFFFGNTAGSGSGAFYIRKAGSGTGLEVGLWRGGYETVVISGDFFDESWKHITWTISTTGVWTFYVNSTNQNITKTSAFTNADYTTEKRIMGATANDFYGNIDDFRIYSSVLSATQVSELYNGRVEIYNNASSGGSGGGGGTNQSGASAGTANTFYSLLTAGFAGTSSLGGNGGSATSSGRYTTNITGSLLTVGGGGLGVSSSASTAATKTNYGDGGDGNGGSGFQGAIIFNFDSNATNLLNFKTDNVNITSLNVNCNITIGGNILKPDGSVFINPTTTDNKISSQWKTTGNNIYYNQGFVGIGTLNPRSDLHLHSSNTNTDVILRLTDATTGSTSNDGFMLEKDRTGDGYLWNYENSSLIFGTNNQERIRVTSTGRVGIGTTNPQGLVDIRGDLLLSGSLLKLDRTPFITPFWSNSTINANNIYYTAGNIGIGTTNPQELLHVNNGNLCVTNGNIGIGTISPISALHLHSNTVSVDVTIRLTDNTTGIGGTDGVILRKDSNQNAVLWNYENASLILGTNNQQQFIITSNGNIGIGITNPITKLQVAGTINTNELLIKGTNVSNIIDNKINVTSNILYDYKNLSNVPNLAIYATIESISSKENPLTFNSPFSRRGDTISLNLDSSLSLDSSGKLKITNPTPWNTTGNDIYYSLGKVGIGIASPTQIFQVGNGGRLRIANDNTDYSLIGTIDTDASTNTKIIISGKNRGGTNLGGNIEYYATGSAGKHLFYTTDASTERMRIDSSGNVGVNITNPLSVLHVGGDIRLSGNLLKTDGTNYISSINWVANSTNVYFNTGSVAIGKATNDTNYKLEVINNAIIGTEVVNKNSYNHSTAPLTLTNTTSTSASVLNDTLPILHLCREGTNEVSYGVRATFRISRYENSGTNSRTRLDLTMANGAYDDINVMTFRSDQCVGINNTNPLSTLHVGGDIRLSGSLLKNDGTSLFSANQWTTNGTAIYYNGGNVGVGIASPNSLLHLHATTTNTDVILKLTDATTGTTATDGLILEKDSTQAGILMNYENADLIFGTNATEQMRITNDGRIGIGTNNPTSTYILHIHNQTPSSLRTGIYLSDSSSGLASGSGITKTNINDLAIGTTGANDIQFLTNNSEVMRIKNTGFVGINRTSPQSALDVNGDVRITGNLLKADGSAFTILTGLTFNNINPNVFYYNSGQLNIFNFDITTSGATKTLTLSTNNVNVNALNVNNSLIVGQKLGVKVANPIYPLEVASDNSLTNSFATTVGLLGTSGASTSASPSISGIVIKANGAIWSTSQFIASSDSRIKNNISNIEDDGALQKILKIEPKTYNYIDFISKGSSNVYGFIAQQIKDEIPEAVSLNSEFIPNIYSIGFINNYNNSCFITTSNNLPLIKFNDEVKIITEDSKIKDYKITAIHSSNCFSINEYLEGTSCIVYGIKVNDFHTLDKSYIFTLNVCATQELYKIIKQQQEQINQLQNQLEQFEQLITSNF